ncbi:hypothetical protein MIMGU_mgv1a023412mg, partial [Erythranthe guttata]
AGKWTNGIPVRGVYGPLISAISVDPGKRLLIILTVYLISLSLSDFDSIFPKLKGVDLHTGSYTLRLIKTATNNFDPAKKIGEGGFGHVFKQGNREFVNEIGMISALQHPHLVKLHGCCIEGNRLLLVYEYLESNSLARALFEEHQIHMDWPTRQKICIGISRGLAYLHVESGLQIVHRDIKATNVLLAKGLLAKISDFGLAELDEEDNTHISTRIARTFGYMAREYAMRGHLTLNADIYNFGVVLLEIISRRSNSSNRDPSFYLLDEVNLVNTVSRFYTLVLLLLFL